VGRITSYHHAFNIGMMDATALARVDLERMRLAAEVQTNLLPSAVGPGFMRPGLEYLGSTDGNAATRLKEFVFGATDASLMEFSDQSLRIRTDDELVTRPAVTAAVTSGNFGSSTGWTLTATDGATSTVSGGYLNLTALPRGSSAAASQEVTINEAGVEHALRIVVDRGPVTFFVGTTAGTDNLITETDLRTGTHSLSFTPGSGSFFINFSSESRNLRRVDSCTVEAAGVMELPTPWVAADLDYIRVAQSADVVFVACRGYQQRRIERRSATSWSVVLYRADDGPFRPSRTRTVKMKPSVTEGNGTLTSSAKFFRSTHVGALFRLFHSGQNMTFELGAEDTYTEPLRVFGISTDNAFDVTITGTWVGTITVQRSTDDAESGYLSAPTTWEDSPSVTFTANGSETFDPGSSLDNVVQWSRLGFEPGDYTSGSATIAMEYGGGGDYGICRVTAYNSTTSVDIEVLRPFRGTEYTADWREGEWSGMQIWPSAVAFSDGRLWWSGSDRIWGSVSDAFESFDEDEEGDAGPINRSIATGGVNDTQWLLSLQRLLIGTEGSISAVKSSSLDEPITPAVMSIRDTSTTGVAPVDPAKLDTRALAVERSGEALLEIVFDGGQSEYRTTQLSKLTTELFDSGVKEIAVQRRPDTRIWMVLNDGSCVCLLYEPDQEVAAFVPISTSGAFESVAVLPAANQDRVYFVVNRTVDGNTVRYVEKMATDAQVKPETRCRVMDAFTVGTNGPASTTVNVGTHLEGETVVVWADGGPIETAPGVRGEFVVNGSGNITVPSAVTNWVAGLPYRMRYKSARLAYGAQGGTAMLQKKTLHEVGLILTNFTRWGIKVGPSFGSLYSMPGKVLGQVPSDIVLDEVHDECPFTRGGSWTLDDRLCIEVESPFTCTLLGITLSVETHG
jgi:hypothetical protein